MVHYCFTGYCVSLLGCIIFCLVLRNSALNHVFSAQRTLAVVLEPLRDAVLVEPVVAFVVVFILLNGFASLVLVFASTGPPCRRPCSRRGKSCSIPPRFGDWLRTRSKRTGRTLLAVLSRAFHVSGNLGIGFYSARALLITMEHSTNPNLTEIF